MTSLLISNFSSTFFEQLHQQIKPCENLSLILAKIEMDSTLHALTTLFTEVFEKEIKFGLRGKLIRTDKHEIKPEEYRLRIPTCFQCNHIQRKFETVNESFK